MPDSLRVVPELRGRRRTATVDVGGVRLDDSVTVGGTRLMLNGAGIRYSKAIFKVYTAALYIGKKASTPDEVLATPGPKRLSVTMLREIDSTELGRLFARGMEDNMDKGSFSRIVPGVVRVGQIFSEHRKLMPGEQFMVEWIPGLGTVITVKGVPGRSIQGARVFRRADADLARPHAGGLEAELKDALLGKAG